MFEKVLVVEDHEIMNLSLRRTLEDMQLPRPNHAYDCDIALAMLTKALQTGQAYDLLVTDLYFERDGSAEQLPEGEKLIQQARALQPDLKILVLSAESRTPVIRRLFDQLHINGYVRKARRDAQELRLALEKLRQHGTYYPRELRPSNTENLHEFTEYDQAVIRLLAEGVPQKAIPAQLAEMGLTPTKLSSMEKRLKLIRTALNFSTNQQLLLYCKDIGLL